MGGNRNLLQNRLKMNHAVAIFSFFPGDLWINISGEITCAPGCPLFLHGHGAREIISSKYIIELQELYPVDQLHKIIYSINVYLSFYKKYIFSSGFPFDVLLHCHLLLSINGMIV